MKKYIAFIVIGMMLCVFHSQNTFAQKKDRDLLYEGTMHVAISTEITFASCMFLSLKRPQMSNLNKYLISSGFTVIIGAGKEFADLKLQHEEFDWIDMGFNMAGIGTGILLHYLVFDRPKQRANLSISIVEGNYLASFKYNFN